MSGWYWLGLFLIIIIIIGIILFVTLSPRGFLSTDFRKNFELIITPKDQSGGGSREIWLKNYPECKQFFYIHILMYGSTGNFFVSQYWDKSWRNKIDGYHPKANHNHPIKITRIDDVLTIDVGPTRIDTRNAVIGEEYGGVYTIETSRAETKVLNGKLLSNCDTSCVALDKEECELTKPM